MYLFDWLRNWWGKSLRRRLLVSSVATLLFFLILLGYLSFRTGQVSVRAEVNKYNSQLATLIAKDINAHFNSIWDNVRLFTYQLTASSDTLLLQARAMLELRRAAPLTYRALYLFNNEGHLLVHLDDSLKKLLVIQDVKEIIERPAIPLTDEILTAYEASKHGELFVSPVYIVGLDHIPMMYLSFPVVFEKVLSSQIIVAKIDLRDIWRKVDKIRAGKTGRTFVVSREGIIIAHPDRAYIGQPLAPALRPVLNGYEGQTEYTDPFSKCSMLASYSPVGRKPGWGIVVEQERTEAFAPINRIAFITLGILLAAIVMATIITILIAYSIIHPIHSLAQVTQTIAHTGDLSQNVMVTGQDEVGQLADTFNQMITSLRQAEQEIHNMNAELELRVVERTAQLESANKELHKTQEELIRKERLAVLGQLSGGVGHELRNPLATISTAVYYLKMAISKEDKTIREYLELIASEVRKSEKIISDLLDFSRIQSVEREKLAVADLVHQVLEKYPPPEGIHVITRIPFELPPIVVDPQQVEQVLINLFTNAYQAMPDGGCATITADQINKSDSIQQPTSKIRIQVSDTGCGITKEHLEKVFEPLFTTKVRGIGLGLAVSKNLIEANEGTIHVASEIGTGTTFTIVLPMKEVAA